MVDYSYRCEETYCGEIFYVNRRMGESSEPVKCPECGSQRVHRVILPGHIHMKPVLTPMKPQFRPKEA